MGGGVQLLHGGGGVQERHEEGAGVARGGCRCDTGGGCRCGMGGVHVWYEKGLGKVLVRYRQHCKRARDKLC